MIFMCNQEHGHVAASSAQRRARQVVSTALDCSGVLLQPLVTLVALEIGFDGGIHDVTYDPAAGTLVGGMGMGTVEASCKQQKNP